jgi:hypothetical protein
MSPGQRTGQRHISQNCNKTFLEEKERNSKGKEKKSTARKAVGPCLMARRH